MRPYVSIDIETTGISDESHILQIAAVYDDLVSPIDELKTFNVAIKYDVMTHCEPYAMGMNAELLKKLMDKNFGITPENSVRELMRFLGEVSRDSSEKLGKTSSIILAGKNVASFDIPKLKLHVDSFGGMRASEEFYRLIHYKTLDVGSLYYDVFGDNVSLSKINELTRRKEVSHDALDDAMDVVYAVRHKLNIK